MKQGQVQVRLDLQVALGEAFFADAFGGAADGLGVDALFGQVQEESAALLEGDRVSASVDDLLEQTGAEDLQVNAQALGLREKKPCGRGGKWRRARTRRSLRRRSW